jgi:hypothetical protein
MGEYSTIKTMEPVGNSPTNVKAPPILAQAWREPRASGIKESSSISTVEPCELARHCRLMLDTRPPVIFGNGRQRRATSD